MTLIFGGFVWLFCLLRHGLGVLVMLGFGLGMFNLILVLGGVWVAVRVI